MIIGIGGVSRAGKSTLANLLTKLFIARGNKVLIFSQDDYIQPEERIPIIRDRVDWEVPESIRISDFSKDILEARKHHNLIIAEGLFCFYDPLLVDQMSRKIYIHISKDIFLHRKKEDLRWGSTPDPDWYMEHIWNRHQRYGIPSDLEQYFTVDGSQYFDLIQIMQYCLREQPEI